MGRTELAEEYFFSVLMAAPDRWAALRADLPRTTVSREPAPGPRTRLPILVCDSQSSDIVMCVWFFLAGLKLLAGVVARFEEFESVVRRHKNETRIDCVGLTEYDARGRMGQVTRLS